MSARERENFSADSASALDPFSLIRCVAALVIVWSHFGGLLPEKISAIATGGTLGNSLFFFASGYALFESDMANWKRWFFRRYTRIYPSWWIYFAVVCALGLATFSWRALVVPEFWFLACIAVFYVLFWFTCKFLRGNAKIFVMGGGMVMSVAILYGLSDYHKWEISNTGSAVSYTYYFAVMVFGAWLRERGKNLEFSKSAVLGLVASVLGFYAVSIFCRHWYLPAQSVLPLFLFPFCFFACKSAKIVEKVRLPEFVCVPVAFISTLTLDIYLVQFVLIEHCKSLPFPLGICVCVVSIFASAVALNFFAGKLTASIRRIFDFGGKK